MNSQRYFELSEAVTPEALRNNPEDKFSAVPMWELQTLGCFPPFLSRKYWRLLTNDLFSGLAHHLILKKKKEHVISDTGSVLVLWWSGGERGRGICRAILNHRHPLSVKCFCMCTWDYVLLAIDGRKYELRMTYLRNNYVKMTEHCPCTRSEGV